PAELAVPLSGLAAQGEPFGVVISDQSDGRPAWTQLAVAALVRVAGAGQRGPDAYRDRAAALRLPRSSPRPAPPWCQQLPASRGGKRAGHWSAWVARRWVIRPRPAIHRGGCHGRRREPDQRV